MGIFGIILKMLVTLNPPEKYQERGFAVTEKFSSLLGCSVEEFQKAFTTEILSLIVYH